MLRVVLQAVAALLILVTALPLIESDKWWIRLWDFPRLQIAALIVLVLVLLAWTVPRGPRLWSLAALLLIAFAWQVARIAPYLPLWPKTVASAVECDPLRSFSLLNANVLMTNRNYSPLLRLVGQRDPDVVLLLEPGSEWAKAIEPLHAHYPFRLGEPLPNTYGILLLSKLPLEEARVRRLVDPQVPSVQAKIRLPSGDALDFYGVHPEPPLPGDDSGERDAELVIIGREVRSAGTATVVMGDLNDVAWSDTSRLFRKISGTQDPRAGRGLYPTFPVAYPLLRYPLDHIFVTPHFRLQAIDRLPAIGSDHFPLYFRICLTGSGQRRHVRPALGADAQEDASDQIQDGLEERAEEHGR